MSKLTDNYTGIYSLMLTTYNDDLTVDYNAYEEYADWQVAQGVEHLFAVCGSSEMASLTLEERVKLAELTVKHKGNTTVVATANVEPSWFAQVEEVKRITATGVDGIVFTTKGFGKDPDRLVNYIGELKAYTEMMNDARALATKRMVAEAEEMGADAIVNVRYASSAVMQGAAEVMAYGTAVKFIQK